MVASPSSPLPRTAVRCGWSARNAADQRGLADPRSPPDQRDAGTVGAHLREQRVQDAEFVLAPDERLISRCLLGTRRRAAGGEPGIVSAGPESWFRSANVGHHRMLCPIVVGRRCSQLGRCERRPRPEFPVNGMDPDRRAVHPPARVLTWAISRGAAWEAVALALAAFETAVDYASTPGSSARRSRAPSSCRRA